MFLLYIKYQWLSCDFCGVTSEDEKVHRVQKVQMGKVLRIDRPDGRRVLKFDGLSGRGLWYRPQGDEYKVSVTGLAVCVICDTISSATYFLVSP